MGYASRARGTYEERKARAIAKREEEQRLALIAEEEKKAKMLAEWRALPPSERAAIIENRNYIAFMLSMAMSHIPYKIL